MKTEKDRVEESGGWSKRERRKTGGIKRFKKEENRNDERGGTERILRKVQMNKR